MTYKLFLLLFIIYYSTVIMSCGKDKTPVEDPRNLSLLKKSPSEIKQIVTGKWRVVGSEICTIAGCATTYYTYNAADIIKFLVTDTVIRTNFNEQMYFINEKASISKQYSSEHRDSVYVYELPNSLNYWIMQEVKNDTLIINRGVGFLLLVK